MQLESKIQQAVILGKFIYQELRIGMIKEGGMAGSDSVRGCMSGD